MKKPIIIVGVLALLLVVSVAWQITAAYVANAELESDMQDLAVQNGARAGLSSFETEEELRDDLIARAKGHGIELAPEQVKVDRKLTPRMLNVSISADYDARINLAGASIKIHFTPSRSHRGEIIVK